MSHLIGPDQDQTISQSHQEEDTSEKSLISVPNIPPPRAPSASPRNQSCENPQLYNWIYSSHSPGQNWKDQPDLQAVSSHSLKSDHGVQGRSVQLAETTIGNNNLLWVNIMFFQQFDLFTGAAR